MRKCAWKPSSLLAAPRDGFRPAILEVSFFRTDLQKICDASFVKFENKKTVLDFSAICHLDITLVKVAEFPRTSKRCPLNFHEDVQDPLSRLKLSIDCVDFAETCAKVLKMKKSGMLHRK